jgi:hypothetical protein
MANIYDLIDEQHGVRFNATKMGDHSHNWVKGEGASTEPVKVVEGEAEKTNTIN